MRRGHREDLVVPVSYQEEAVLHLGLDGALIAALKAIGLEIAKLEIGRISVIGVVKEVI